MNLHGIAASIIGAVNPNIQVQLSVSTGDVVQADGTRVPQFEDPVAVWAQVQPMSYRDLAQLDGVNQGGVKWKVYLSGQVDAVVRPDRKGGDLIVIETGPHQGTWLVVQVLEQFPDWVSAAIVLQNGS